MSPLADRLAELASPGPRGSDTRATNTPEAWRPRMEIDAKGGYLVSTPHSANEMPDAAEILKDFGLDPELWVVTGLRRSKWQTYYGEWLEAYRITVAPAETVSDAKSDLDLESLVDEIRKWRPRKAEKNITGDLAYLLAPSDQQIGKKQGGEGTAESVARILNGTEGAVWRLDELRKVGRGIGTVVLALPGDHVEGNVSQNGKLQGQAASDLGLTEQTRVARRLLMGQIKTFAPKCERLIVPVVNGNHDEVTRMVSADPSDGWNVEIASAVQDACAENPELGHVEFRFPDIDSPSTSTGRCWDFSTAIRLGKMFSSTCQVKPLGRQPSACAISGSPVTSTTTSAWISGSDSGFRPRRPTPVPRGSETGQGWTRLRESSLWLLAKAIIHVEM